MTCDTNEFDWHNDLPHPCWEDLYRSIESLTLSEQSDRLTLVIDRWLGKLAEALGAHAGVLSRDEMRLMYSSTSDQAERLLTWSSSALARVITIVGEHRTPEMIGPRVIILFDDHDRYYDYIDRFYPDAGEYTASSGMCVSQDYYHIVIGPGDFASRQSTLAHELTHLALGPLSIPIWLNEGIAQMMQEMLVDQQGSHLDHETVRRHQAHWQREGLQAFWTGESFHYPENELSYHLAEVLTRRIVSDHRDLFIEFVKRADWQDAGESAARDVLGSSLGDIATTFLGRGDWKPLPVEA